MNRKGVLYDVGRVMGGNLRPDYDPRLVRRELEIISGDLHCTAVKVCARDVRRLVVASEAALELGLEVWFCPELWGKDPPTTLQYLARAADAAGELERRWPGRVVFSIGTELSFFMRGILAGRTYAQRSQVAALPAQIASGEPTHRLNAFLADAVRQVRRAFSGPVTYASLPFEQVDWTPFDIVGIDHYWMESVKDRYVARLEPLRAIGKPLVISELGFRTRTGAELTGPMGPENLDLPSFVLHRVPLVGRAVRPRVREVHERDERLQADLLFRQLELLASLGVDGAFVYTFVSPILTHDDDPRHDLDTDSFSLVKSYLPGRHGMTYSDMPWEPKEAFGAIARFYAQH